MATRHCDGECVETQAFALKLELLERSEEPLRGCYKYPAQRFGEYQVGPSGGVMCVAVEAVDEFVAEVAFGSAEIVNGVRSEDQCAGQHRALFRGRQVEFWMETR